MPERRQLAGPRVEHRRAEPDQLLGGHRVGDRDEDPDRAAGVRGGHRPRRDRPRRPRSSASTRYGLSSSNSRAWRSTRSSAWSVVTLRFSMTKLADPPEVDRHERGDERLERRLRVARGDDQVVDDPGPDVVREVERGHRVGHLEGRRRGRGDVAADARAASGRRPRAGRPRRPARAPSRAWPGRASAPTCRRGSASRRGTRTGAGACSPRAAAAR